MYGMRRANGDWFAFSDSVNTGDLCMPVFRGTREGMLARGRYSGMLLFKPVLLDTQALNSLLPVQGERVVRFSVVENSSSDVRFGPLLDYAQLLELTQKA